MFTIHTTNENQEILRKLLNSVAGKYDCGVRFSRMGRAIVCEGDRACAMEIIKETLNMFALNAAAPLKKGGC